MDDLTNPETLQALLALAVEGAKTGNAWLLIALAVVALVFVARKFLGPKIPFFATKAGGALLTLLSSFGGAVTAALASGQKMTPILALGAFKIAFAAAGGWTIVKHLFTLFQGTDPAQIKTDAMLKGVEAGTEAIANGNIQDVKTLVNAPDEKP